MNTVGGFPVEVLEKGKDLRDLIRSKIASPVSGHVRGVLYYFSV